MRYDGILPAANCQRPFWAKLIFAFDSWLQRRGGVFKYSEKSDCIFRLQLRRLSSGVVLSDGTCGHPGDRVVDLHLWNEQIPAAPKAGDTLGWGRRFDRRISESLRGLAHFLESRSELSDVQIIRASINLEFLVCIAVRHGFERACGSVEPSTWECVNQFGENVLYWLLAAACNPYGARPKFWRRRQLLYLSRRILTRDARVPAIMGSRDRPR